MNLLRRLEDWLGIELEVNPATKVSRGARAERSGDITAALRLYWTAGDDYLLLQCLRTAIADRRLRETLLAAAIELLDIQGSVERVRTAGLSGSIADRLLTDTHDAADALWRSAGRIAAAEALKSRGNVPLDGLGHQADRLEALLGAVRRARDSAASLALSGEDLDTVEMRFRELSDAAQGLKGWLDEP